MLEKQCMHISFKYFCISTALFCIPLGMSAMVTADNLIKCPDFSSVYYLAQDGKRYVFPNDKIYFSWYEDFSEVKDITCPQLAEYPVGGVISYQPGTKLVKIPTDPKVYYVSDDNVLRAIKSEAQARELFGEKWASRVDDLSESFFVNYKVEDELEEGIPENSILEDEQGRIFEYVNGEAIEISDRLDEKPLRLKQKFALKLKNIAQRLKNALSFTFKENGNREEILERVEHKLKAKRIEKNKRQIVTPLRELVQQRDETKEAMTRAEREIQKAQDRIQNYTHLTQAQEKLDEAKSRLQEANAAFDKKDYVEAEKLAKQAQERAAKIKDEAEQKEEVESQTLKEEDALGIMAVDQKTGIEYMKSGYASWYKYKNCDCAASPDFPKGSEVKVTAWNGNSVVVVINDWGPEREVFDEPRPIDLDYTAFEKLGKPSLGILRVEVEPISIPLH